MRQVFRTRPWVLLHEPQPFIDFFRREGKLLEIDKGDSFLTHGTAKGQTGLLLEGLVTFDFVDSNGRQRPFAIILPGRMLGDLDVLNPLRPNVVVEVLRPSRLLVVDNQCFRAFLRESTTNMELYADLSILKEESIIEGAFANFTMDLDARLRTLFLSILQAEHVVPDAEGWLTLPLDLSVTEIAGVVSASRVWVSTAISDLCEKGLMRKQVRTMAFRAELFKDLHDWMPTSENVRPTSIFVS